MAKLSLPTSEVTQEHLQNLISQGYMIEVVLANSSVPIDPTSLASAGGYVVASVAFFE
jgi:hypothetical protein